ncbi:MAG TPA: retropepsin-like aspartic protease [Rhodanobacter sp.]|nr:retropepsin-like aspartic protease [Rhodanobacter sp.]
MPQPWGYSPYIQIAINGVTVFFVIDTGAPFSMIPVELADELGLRGMDYREPVTDLTQIAHAYRVAIVDRFGMGATTIRNFPILIENAKEARTRQAGQRGLPILGMDALIFLRRFALSRHRLVLSPSDDTKCVSPARLSTSIEPFPAVFFDVETDHGRVVGTLDTGE